MCRSTHAGPQSHRRDAGGQPGFVPRIADRHAIALAQRRDGPKIQFLIVGRIGAAGVQQDQILRCPALPRHGRSASSVLMPVERMIGLPLGAGVAQQVVVGEGGRGNLVAGHIELVDEIDRSFVPAGGEPWHLDFAAVAIDLLVFVVVRIPGRASGRHWLCRRAFARLAPALRPCRRRRRCASEI